MKTRPRTALDLLDELAGDDPVIAAHGAVARLNGDLAQLIFDAREASGMDPVPDELDFRDYTVEQLALLLWDLGAELHVTAVEAEHKNLAVPTKRRKTG